MKGLVGITWLAAFILCVFTSISAQEKSVSEQQITAIKNSAAEKLSRSRFRVKMTSESYKNADDSAPFWFYSSTMEITPDGYHSVVETKSDARVNRTEIVKFGGRKFFRSNSGSWREVSSTDEISGTGGEPSVPLFPVKSVEYKYLGRDIINGQNVYTYEIKTFGSDSVSFNTETMWVNKEGLYVKKKFETRQNKKVISTLVYDYEYDPNIKIEAPVK